MNHEKQIENYLMKIDREQPVSLAKFLKLLKLPDLNLEIGSDDVVARKVSGALYKVTHIAPWLRGELGSIVNSRATDRVSAARQNNSHAYNVNGSILLVREGEAHPQVLMFDTDGQYTPSTKPYSNVLMIENRQNFISIDQTIQFVVNQCQVSSFDINNTLMVFAEGNAVSNALHKSFLSEFKSLYLLFDVDAGGLQIASNLITLLPNADIVFLTPLDIKQRLEKVRARAATNSVEKIMLLGRKHHQLTPIAKLICDTERELEQESYLND